MGIVFSSVAGLGVQAGSFGIHFVQELGCLGILLGEHWIFVRALTKIRSSNEFHGLDTIGLDEIRGRSFRDVVIFQRQVVQHQASGTHGREGTFAFDGLAVRAIF